MKCFCDSKSLEWLWPIITTLLGALIAIISNLINENSKRKTQIKLEKLKIYDEKKFKAYTDLHEFISVAYSFYWPPDEPRREFVTLMKRYFFKLVKIHYPYFRKDVREKVKNLEDQYFCLGDSDLRPKISFEEFIRDHYLPLLNDLNLTVEKIFDEWDDKLI